MEDPYSSFMQLLVMILLLTLSAVFSASETALTSLSRLKLIKKNEQESIHRVNRMLTAVLIMNNFVNLMLSSVATLLFVRLFRNFNEGLVAVFGTIFVTFIVLVVGEISPKIYAREYAERVYQRVDVLLRLLDRLLSPLVSPLLRISNLVVRLIGGKAMEDAPFITSEDIINAVNVGTEGGTIGKQEGMIVEQTFKMSETDIKEIMTPRVDVVAINENATIEEFFKLVNEEGYSRIPVFREDIDDIVGICYVKDAVALVEQLGWDAARSKKVSEIMREPIFAPETMKVSTLLKIFKEKKMHMAIVVDEFGGTAGIVTLEDILEELVGEIMDEYDYDETSNIRKVSENSYIVKGTTPLNDIERELDVEFPPTEHETLAGYLLEQFQRIPSVGEELDVNGFHFKIVAATKSKIDRVLMTIKRREADERKGTDRKGD
ncbi:hemolysin [Thermotoga sp. Ku-13t]|uniref:hemolysin family protein n=1 Tax=Thermotoga sp. Ku-13t TaxID=1755813 RepID=UPI0013E9FB40|nr:hemolysin family protein [Thermotoga sp. Ku-13t]KAF2958294.1 hemolysin [Thermotoga sp. Ku-13t]